MGVYGIVVITTNKHTILSTDMIPLSIDDKRYTFLIAVKNNPRNVVAVHSHCKQLYLKGLTQTCIVTYHLQQAPYGKKDNV